MRHKYRVVKELDKRGVIHYYAERRILIFFWQWLYTFETPDQAESYIIQRKRNIENAKKEVIRTL